MVNVDSDKEVTFVFHLGKKQAGLVKMNTYEVEIYRDTCDRLHIEASVQYSLWYRVKEHILALLRSVYMAIETPTAVEFALDPEKYGYLIHRRALEV